MSTVSVPGEGQNNNGEITVTFSVSPDTATPEWQARFAAAQQALGELVGGTFVDLRFNGATQQEPVSPEEPALPADTAAEDQQDVLLTSMDVVARVGHNTDNRPFDNSFAVARSVQRATSVGLHTARDVLAVGMFGLNNAGFNYDQQTTIAKGVEKVTGAKVAQKTGAYAALEWCTDLSQVPALALFSKSLLPVEQRTTPAPRAEEWPTDALLQKNMQELSEMSDEALTDLIIARRQIRGVELAPAEAAEETAALRREIVGYTISFHMGQRS